MVWLSKKANDVKHLKIVSVTKITEYNLQIYSENENCQENF